MRGKSVERGESFVGVVIIPKKAAAYSQDHRAMPAHESFESRFVPPLDVMFQQLDVAQAGSIVRRVNSPGGPAISHRTFRV